MILINFIDNPLVLHPNPPCVLVRSPELDSKIRVSAQGIDLRKDCGVEGGKGLVDFKKGFLGIMDISEGAFWKPYGGGTRLRIKSASHLWRCLQDFVPTSFSIFQVAIFA